MKCWKPNPSPGLLFDAIVVFISATALSVCSHAQYKERPLGIGVRVGGVISQTEFSGNASGFLGRAHFRYAFIEQIAAELGVGFGVLNGYGFNSRFFPVDIRLAMSPFTGSRWSPYLYIGGGGMFFKSERGGNKLQDQTAYIPAGGGVQFKVDNIVAIDLSAGYNKTFSDTFAPTLTNAQAGFWNFSVGISQFGQRVNNRDRELPGLVEEKRISANPLGADSDMDGLNDGDEVHSYKTNPSNPDTDSDGLKDGDEIKIYLTDPLNHDSDGDGLSDGVEVLKLGTSPVKIDTDGDALTDGDEVLIYKTNPLEIDTDKGTVADGIEVHRGSDPLNVEDDMPLPTRESLTVETGKALILEVVAFKFDSDELLLESEETLGKAYNSMRGNPEIEVEIHGHTDNVGKPSYNLRLSQARANSVKKWLVKKGISASRITARGFASVRPIATNSTEEGRVRNRRIELLRVR